MATTRQDAWTEDEDLLLAEVVLRHIRESGTQLSAFKEVGRSLSRTPAACGFRWNSSVRKQYKEQIEEAKQQRKGALAPAAAEEVQASVLTMDLVISFLQNYKERRQEPTADLLERIQFLEQKTEQLQKEKDWLLKKLSIYEEEYKTLFEYIDQKRNFVAGDHENKMQLLRERNVLEKIEK
ncbi:RsfA family transcriptional regulator [Ectobacillus panaciterrae]|uniref:RsfA family transcriptional regulator n=1 Tax=Ectobacillus panaciterrae TaxID=363872 RepID=UPI00041E58AB|nr:RsfA family transcriptional regulator [Ectobacillus panaciterrae]